MTLVARDLIRKPLPTFRDHALCRRPRLSPGATVRAARGWRRSAQTWRADEPTWFNAPVPSFGPLDARLLIVGLAPGLQGANRTGRPFTGDYAGVLLYDTLVALRLCARPIRRASR